MNANINVSAQAVVFNEDSVLLAKEKGESFYFLPGANIEFGDNAKQTVAKNLQRLTFGSGYKILEPIGFFEDFYADDCQHQQYVILFLAWASNPDAITSDKENLDFKFIKLSDLKNTRLEYDWLADAIINYYQNEQIFIKINN